MSKTASLIVQGSLIIAGWVLVILYVNTHDPVYPVTATFLFLGSTAITVLNVLSKKGKAI